MFWIAAVLALRPRWPPWRVAAAVLAVTCLLEVLQLWQPPLLQQVRGTFAGRALLGTTFVWWDFPHYAAGAAAGGGLGSWLRGRVAAQRPPCAGAPSRRR